MESAHLGLVRRRLAAIERARENVERHTKESMNEAGRRSFWKRSSSPDDESLSFVFERNREADLAERKRVKRVKEIDRNIADSQRQLQELICEKDVLQRRPNPLWTYSTDLDELEASGAAANTTANVEASRRFNFPPKELVDDYLDMLLTSGRLIKLNHTDLWRTDIGFGEEDDDDEWLSPKDCQQTESCRRERANPNRSGNWLLRNGLGEKIGETAETAGYKAVCGSIMSVLARSLSSLHGMNILSHADIRLTVESSLDLPPMAASMIPGSRLDGNYARETLEEVMMRGAKKKRRSSSKRRARGSSFIQRDAVVETLLYHCQTSAPLLNLFPLIWQRALLGNIITLITAVISDFFEGLEFQILGHRLSFAFTPISEEDMIAHLGSLRNDPGRRRASPEQFEAAVQATAADLSEELKFLDKWHERALGGRLLRMQIANLIARLVLTLVDDILHGARMNLWSAHAGGPRLVAGLEYRTGGTPKTSTGTPRQES